jgi:hemerythrin-like domain-containing protein
VIQPNSWIEHETIKNINDSASKLIMTNEYKQLEQIPEKFRSAAIRDFVSQMNILIETLSKVLSLHFNREEEVIFPIALRAIEEKGWKDIIVLFDKFGESTCCSKETT